MRYEHKNAGGDEYFLVIADRDEIVVNGHKIPFSFYMGTIDADTGKITVWTPAVSVPKGYRDVALIKLDKVCRQLKRSGQIGVDRRPSYLPPV